MIFYSIFKSLRKKKLAELDRDRHVCDECQCVFQTKSSYQFHLAQKHPEYRGFLCSTCGKAFRGQKGLSHHNTYTCPQPASQFPCLAPNCSAKFNSPRDVRRHVKNKHATPSKEAKTKLSSSGSREQWKCLQCPTVCSSRKSLRVHGKAAHLEGGEDALPFRLSTLSWGKDVSEAVLFGSKLKESRITLHTHLSNIIALIVLGSLQPLPFGCEAVRLHVLSKKMFHQTRSGQTSHLP